MWDSRKGPNLGSHERIFTSLFSFSQGTPRYKRIFFFRTMNVLNQYFVKYAWGWTFLAGIVLKKFNKKFN